MSAPGAEGPAGNPWYSMLDPCYLFERICALVLEMFARAVMHIGDVCRSQSCTLGGGGNLEGMCVQTWLGLWKGVCIQNLRRGIDDCTHHLLHRAYAH